MTRRATSSSRAPQYAESVYGPEPVPLDDPAELYHEASSFYRSHHVRQTPGTALSETVLHDVALRGGWQYADAPVTRLPPPHLPERPLSDVLQRRESSRDYGGLPIEMSELSGILFAAQGVFEDRSVEGLPSRRTAPSGGALHPLEVNLRAENVRGLSEGLYHFNPSRHALEQLPIAPSKDELAHAFAHSHLIDRAAIVIVITAVIWRSRFKYGLRSYRFALIEAGHVAQNIILATAAYGIPSCPIGGFYDRELNALLDCDGVNDFALYAIAIGGR
jgi:SagB-type dehydrogenase family enzyme